MLPVKPNNQSRQTRANNRKNPKAKDEVDNQFGNPKSKKSKSKNKEIICANQSADTTQIGEPTVNTGLVSRKHIQLADTKTTIRKACFQNKPIIKEVNKKLINYSKQYAPEYFTTILEYMIDKEIRNTASPTADKINKWRIYIQRQRRIQIQVRREVRKMANMIITGRKKFKESIRHEQGRQYLYSSQEDSFKGNVKSERYQQQQESDASQLSNNSSSAQNASCPDLINIHSNIPPIEALTQNQISKQWQYRFDQFACLVQTMYQLLGQNECDNTIVPACYIFYTLILVDAKVFNFMNHTTKCSQNVINQQNGVQNRYMSGSKYREPTNMQMVQYYVIISILIATKYHQIYPASLADLIQSVNSTLSYDRAIKIEGQVLEMFDFTQFFNENELKFLSMFGVVVGLNKNEMNICQFLLQSGLNNPKIYAYSPLYKAAVIIGIYEQQFLKTQQKFMVIKNLCPGLTLQLANKIKKQYMQIIIYNYKNKLNSQKKKFFIFDNEMKNLVGRDNGI